MTTLSTAVLSLIDALLSANQIRPSASSEMIADLSRVSFPFERRNPFLLPDIPKNCLSPPLLRFHPFLSPSALKQLFPIALLTLSFPQFRHTSLFRLLPILPIPFPRTPSNPHLPRSILGPWFERDTRIHRSRLANIKRADSRNVHLPPSRVQVNGSFHPLPAPYTSILITPTPRRLGRARSVPSAVRRPGQTFAFNPERIGEGAPRLKNKVSRFRLVFR